MEKELTLAALDVALAKTLMAYAADIEPHCDRGRHLHAYIEALLRDCPGEECERLSLPYFDALMRDARQLRCIDAEQFEFESRARARVLDAWYERGTGDMETPSRAMLEHVVDGGTTH